MKECISMSLCIAAACQDRGKARVVIATDWKASAGIAAAEIQDKLYWIGDYMPVLIAGTITRAIELKDTYKQYLAILGSAQPAQIQVKLEDLSDFIKEPIKIFRRKLVEEHMARKFGLNYDTFRTAVGKGEIPESVAIEAFTDIAKIDLDCQLIIIVFIDRQPSIFKINMDGTIEDCENFATIGSGTYIAESVLYQRKQDSRLPLGPSVYHVFEAMKLGSIAPGVGEEHTINVLYPPGERRNDVVGEVLTEKAKEFLERQFKKFGPKPFQRLPLPPESWTADF
jgi:hypothetical protein